MEYFSTNLNNNGLHNKDTAHHPDEILIRTNMLKQIPFLRTCIERIKDDCINKECKHESPFI